MSSKHFISETGLFRIAQIVVPVGLIPVSKSTWWVGVRSGRLLKPMELVSRTMVWRVEEMRALFTARTNFYFQRCNRRQGGVQA